MFKMFREIRKAKQNAIIRDWCDVVTESISAIHEVHDGRKLYVSVPMRSAKPERVLSHVNDIIARGGYNVKVKIVKNCYVFGK